MGGNNKNKINFRALVGDANFDIQESNSSDVVGPAASNFLTPKEEDNQSIIKKNKKVKVFEYKKIFDNSLSEHRHFKKTAHIYDYNMDRLKLLDSMNKNVKLTEIINYIINDFFVKNSEEIREENKIFNSELNKNL